MKLHFFSLSEVLPALLFVLLAGCASQPTELLLQPVDSDREMGAEVSQQVAEQIGIVDDNKMTSYLNDVGQHIAKYIPNRRFDYTFQIVDQAESNAFAAPGGYVYVSRGILSLCNSEDELAGVLAHEIVHVGRRHTAKQQAKQRVPNLLSLPGNIVGHVVSQDLGQLLNAPVNLFGMSFLTAYSRQHELEADDLGQTLSAKAGYDPLALAAILGRLEKEAALHTGKTRHPGFFDTHPTTPKRVNEITERAETIEWSPQPGIASDRVHFLRRLEGLRVGENPAKGIFQGQKFLQPDLDFFIEFPPKWKTMNTPKTVGAFSPNQDGGVFLGIQGKGTDPQQVAVVFMQGMKNKFDAKPSRSEAVKVGKWPAYIVTYTDNTGKEPVYMHFLWVAREGLMYQMIGITPERHKEDLRRTALSFRQLTPEERSSIEETLIRVVSAQEDEDLNHLCRRTNNVWNPQITALMNGITEQQPLKQNQPVKIAVKEKYRGIAKEPPEL